MNTIFLRRKEAAERGHFSVRLLEKFATNGDGPPYIRVSARLTLYRIDEFDAWLNARRVTSTADATTKAA
jgi:hypothetical protein